MDHKPGFADYRSMARRNLQNAWPTAALTALVATILGGNLPGSWPLQSTSLFRKIIQRFAPRFASSYLGWLKGFGTVSSWVVILMIICLITIGGFIAAGYCRYNIGLIRKEKPGIKILFTDRHDFARWLELNMRILFFTLLWSCLFIVPGVIKALSWSQAYYIMLEDPDMEPKEAMAESARMMTGRKLEYFILALSFAGWILLTIFTFGILGLWLIPYIAQTMAVYYAYNRTQDNKRARARAQQQAGQA